VTLEAYGKFELLTCLARGGMAEVFLARQRGEGRFERLVVIKRILPEFADDGRFIKMFLEEARIAAMLDHPNVIPIYDLGRVEDSYFIAMPFVSGLTVQAMLKEASRHQLPVPLEIGCEIGGQALSGLQYAHERLGLDGQPIQLVHRDVSPTNLMINEQGRVLLLDFGIASVADTRSEDTGSVRGKLAYMSPEQVRGESLDRRSDLFSLGIVLYELLVGRRLFQRRSDVEVIDAITHDALPDPMEQRADLPEALRQVLRQSLQQDPGRRFQSAAEMGEALESALVPAGQEDLRRYLVDNFSELLDQQQRRITAAREGVLPDESPTRVDRPAAATRGRPRRSVWPWLLGLVVLIVVGGGGIATWLVLDHPRVSGPPLRVGVIPFLPETVLRREWEPLRRYLQRKVHRPVELVVTLSYRQMMDALLQGKVDLADLSAYPFLLARRRDPRLRALAIGVTEHASTYEGYVVICRRSTLRSISSLKGHRVCYVDRTSTSGYLMPRVMVRNAGFDPDAFFASEQFSGDHYRALSDLLAERCDVACVGSTSFNTAGRQGIPVRQLRILATSAPLPHGVYTASSRLSEETVEKLKDALLELDMRQEFGRQRLGENMQVTGFVPVDLQAFMELDREVDRTMRPAASRPAASRPARD